MTKNKRELRPLGYIDENGKVSVVNELYLDSATKTYKNRCPLFYGDDEELVKKWVENNRKDLRQGKYFLL